jgi:hypothetical protein
LQDNSHCFDQSQTRKNQENMPTQENMTTPTIVGDERLILLVQNYKELCDKTGSYHKDKELTENIWTIIATELDVDGEWQA